MGNAARWTVAIDRGIQGKCRGNAGSISSKRASTVLLISVCVTWYGWVDGWMVGWVDSMGGWMGERMDVWNPMGWMGWMDGWLGGWVLHQQILTPIGHYLFRRPPRWPFGSGSCLIFLATSFWWFVPYCGAR